MKISRAAIAAPTALVLALVLFGAPSALAQGADAPESGAMDDPQSSPFSVLGDDAALLTDPEEGSLRTSFDPETDELVQLMARRRVRLITSEIQVRCDLLRFDGRQGQMLAWPEVGGRVEVIYFGLKARCGLLEYYPDTGKAILRREPVIYQIDEKGRELETRGQVITVTRRADGRANVLIESRKSPVPELRSPQPATLIVDTESTEEAQAASLEEMRETMRQAGLRPLNDPENLVDIPEAIRADEDERP